MEQLLEFSAIKIYGRKINDLPLPFNESPIILSTPKFSGITDNG